MATKKNDPNKMKNPAITSSGALDAYERFADSKPGEFKYDKEQPTWIDNSNVQKYANDLLNRKDFSFDVNENALYNQYKDIYTKQAQLGMMDTMGQAAALSGGYGNSYAASAGAQAYQQSLDKLIEKVPELYQLAMQQYQLEGQNLKDKYNVAYGERDAAYGQYRDSVDDYYANREFAYGQHRDGVDDWQYGMEHLYGVYNDAVLNEQSVAKHNTDVDQFNREFGLKEDQFEYDKERDKVLDDQWRQEFAHMVMMDDETLKQRAKELGISETELAEMIRMNDWKIAEAGRSG